MDPQAAPDEPPAPKIILDLLNGFRSSKVLFTLVKLGVIDCIGQQQPHQEHISLPALCKLVAASPACKPAGGAEPSHDGLGRLLDAAVSLGLLKGNRQLGYGLSEVSKAYLLSVSSCERCWRLPHAVLDHHNQCPPSSVCCCLCSLSPSRT